ncbi:MAG: hypothetical protein C5B54_10530 [Acidobacteria bacterium]|nr:MAG: hypothetical protein C5B54_10530 [Acidobacteriota bacterium]
MKKIMILVILVLTAGLVWAQDQQSNTRSKEDAVKAYKDAEKVYTDAAMELQRSDIRSQKREIIKKAVPFTDEQSKAFWPIYDSYEKETIKLNDGRYAMIKEYAANYDNMTDEKATDLITRSMDYFDKRTTLKKTYFENLKKSLPPKVVARLMQLDHQMDLQVDLLIAAQVPLVK